MASDDKVQYTQIKAYTIIRNFESKQESEQHNMWYQHLLQ